MRRIRTVFLVGFATLNLLAPVPMALAGGSGGLDKAQLAQAFLDSDYTTCDADALASAWNKSLDEAKAHIGFKLTEGLRESLEQELSAARLEGLEQNSTCYYFEQSTFGYNDAELLAGHWGVGVLEAKARISYKVGQGDEALLRGELEQAMAQAQAGGEGDESGVHDAAMREDLESFFASDYAYCDAVVISQLWGTSVEDAKATIGYKVRHGYTDMVDTAIREGRKAAYERGRYCHVENAPYLGDGGVALLATHWKLSEPEARKKLEQLLADGDGPSVEAEVTKLRAAKKAP